MVDLPEDLGAELTQPDRTQLARLISAGLDGFNARQANDQVAYSRARSVFDRAWHNSSPAVRTEFETKCERPRGRGRRP